MMTSAHQRAMIRTHRRLQSLREQLSAAQAEISALRDECVACGVEIDRLRLETFTDTLTGAYTRKGLRHVWAERLNRVTAVCLLDCDRFKFVNDRYGHATGDVVLSHIVETIRDHNVVVARTGGDEFALIITDDLDSPETVLARVQAAICVPRTIRGNLVSVTTTIGVCLVDQEPDGPPLSMVNYLDHADAALYEGKRDGRNTIIITKA